ncbi:glycosyltransferase [Paraflavitalea sp. CAU 1676]|uniref:glycosyltransferase family 4 protein n=1 Tax=Paraflavitalea sp. CAU 1676 TaxID=3032598 RepID=UPI0023DBDED4|nr:glycosyltransferase [Paraflavitalea sp. CAU 1676]MDF2189179.1 glycosyltransferase [Paraflavitalea sp. CAU 1676]
MKVLWFTNTPCSAAEKLQIKSHGGGWLKALEQELGKYPEIDLHVCFYSALPYEPFRYGNTHFIPVQRANRASKLQRLLQRITDKNHDAAEIPQLLQVINQVNPEVIHIHGTEENFGLIQQHTNTPAILSIQGILSPLSEKFFAGIPAWDAFRKESLKAKLSFKSAGRLHKTLRRNARREQQILQQCRHVIGRTGWDKQVSRVMSPGSSYHVNNEALRETFYEARWQKQTVGTTLRLVTVASDAIYKGFETIVKAARLLKAYPGLSFEWTIAGLHNASEIVRTTQKWLKADAAQLNIKLVGGLNEQQIATLLQESDIYCQVSHIENSPNSLCEAMLMGMPVIASYAGGTSSLLENEKEGLLVQNGDAHALAGAILQMRSHFEEAVTMGKNARLRAVKRHDKASITLDLIDIYKTVINLRAS